MARVVNAREREIACIPRTKDDGSYEPRFIKSPTERDEAGRIRHYPQEAGVSPTSGRLRQMFIVFNGERIELVETETDDAEAREFQRHGGEKKPSRRSGDAHGSPNVRSIGNDEPCGGGRRIIRKSID